MGKNRVLIPSVPPPPNRKCHVCAPHPTITVDLNVHVATIGFLVDAVLKKELGMIAPDATVDDGKGLVIRHNILS
jgi:hypothetical protein